MRGFLCLSILAVAALLCGCAATEEHPDKIRWYSDTEADGGVEPVPYKPGMLYSVDDDPSDPKCPYRWSVRER